MLATTEGRLISPAEATEAEVPTAKSLPSKNLGYEPDYPRISHAIRSSSEAVDHSVCRRSATMGRLFFLYKLQAALLEVSSSPRKAMTTVLTVRERDQTRFEYRLAGFPGRPGLLYLETLDFEAPLQQPLPEKGADLVYSCRHRYKPGTVDLVKSDTFEAHPEPPLPAGAELVHSFCHRFQSVTVEGAMQFFEEKNGTYDLCSTKVEDIDLMFTRNSHETRGFFIV